MSETMESPNVGVMAVMDRSGDTKVRWDRNNPDEVAAARETFTKLRAKGFLAYRVKKDGSPDEMITEFAADAESIIMTPPMRGG